MFERITHSEEIASLINEAKTIYEDTTERLENQKTSTASTLKYLGEQKLDAWAEDMNEFVRSFSAFNNIQMVCPDDKQYSFSSLEKTSQELMINIENASITAGEMLKVGVTAIGTGALLGVASYGGAMMFARASTGTAIAELSGIAKSNATLAWFGGGSIKTGGFGRTGGKVVLAGIVIAPIVATAGMLVTSKSKEKLAEAKKTNAAAKKAVAQMETMITEMQSIEYVARNYTNFFYGMSSKMKSFISEMDKIASEYQPGEDGKIDFSELSDVEQKTLHISWLLAQLYYHTLSIGILTEDGSLSEEAYQVITTSKEELSTISMDISKLEKEKSKICSLLNEAKEEYEESTLSLLKHKSNLQNVLINIANWKIKEWSENIYNDIGIISSFEDIDVEDLLTYDKFNETTEDIYGNIVNAISISKMLSDGSVESLNTLKYEIAAFGGEKVLFSSAFSGTVDYDEADLHEMSLWLTETSDELNSAHLNFMGLDVKNLVNCRDILKTVSGKENLDQAEEIHLTVMKCVRVINQIVDEFSNVQSRFDRFLKNYNKLTRISNKYLEGVKLIHASKSENENNKVCFESLNNQDKHVIEYTWNILKLKYYLLSASVLSLPNGEIGSDLDECINHVDEELLFIKKMKKENYDEYIKADNIMWKSDALKMIFMNCGIMVALLILMIYQIANRAVIGWINLGGILVACPFFFFIKDLSQRKLYLWRIVRAILSIMIVIVVEIVGMVG